VLRKLQAHPRAAPFLEPLDTISLQLFDCQHPSRSTRRALGVPRLPAIRHMALTHARGLQILRWSRGLWISGL